MSASAGQSNALLSDIQARAERRRLQTRNEQWHDLVADTWLRSQAAAQAGNTAAAQRWLERAHRMLPQDGAITLSLAATLLQAGAAADAAELFTVLAQQHNLAEAWAGLAVSARLLGDMDRARDATIAALRSSVPTPSLRELAEAVAGETGAPGWCGVDLDGVLHTGQAKPDSVRLDTSEVPPPHDRLPNGWRTAALVHAERGGRPLLGSPLPVAGLTRVEGFVEVRDGGLAGWAWHPADPAREPALQVVSAGRVMPLEAREPAAGTLDRPLARPRQFAVTPDALDGAVSVLDRDGRHLLGSPLHPGLERQGASGPVWADMRGTMPAVGPRCAVDVVVPAYRGLAQTLACLHSILMTVPRGTRVHVVDDASPEPDLVLALQGLHRQRRIRLIRLADNRGFPAAANAGLRACAGRDAVLLNSDTVVPPGWLQRLRAAAYSASDIGTVTPLSNDATICSYPDVSGGNPVPDADQTAATDAIAQAANGAGVVDVPTGVGFCMYVRRDCLDQTGPFREDLFAQGYGEENDFCLRARHLGWRHVAATGVFVAHVGGQSFGSARMHLIRRNLQVLNRWHPGYDALIAAHVAADPLAPARHRMDALRWVAGRTTGAVVIVTHGGGGGVDRVVAARAAALAVEGLRVVVLRPSPGGCIVQDAGGDATPNLRFAIPAELPALARLLRPDRVRHLELHHLLGHVHGIVGLARLLRVPVESYVHDYAAFCPRIALVSVNRRYCGEPDVTGCQDCIADLGSLLEDPVSVPDLLARSAIDLGASRRVVAPSHDAASRIRRHFPMARTDVVPWENEAWPPLTPGPAGAIRRVCVVGAIGVEKGYDVLLACVRDARARRLPLEFALVGYTLDDVRLMDAGPITVTGEYKDADATALICAQAAHLGFIPSVWPETWCFALSRAWEAGLAVAAFDLGAQAERIRATRRGWVLPLGLQPAAVNDALLALALAPPDAARHSPAELKLQHQRVSHA